MKKIIAGNKAKPLYSKKQAKPEKALPAREIWTYEPPDDVSEMMRLVLKDAPRGERTKLISTALREKFPEAAAIVAEAEAQAALDRARALRKKAEDKQ